MRWINKLSDSDIENLVKKLGIEHESLKIKKETDYINVYLDSSCWYALVIFDFSIMFCDDEEEYWTFFADFQLMFNFDRVDDYNYRSVDKIFYLFMENKFGKAYLIDLIRHRTGLSGKFLRKKLR